MYANVVFPIASFKTFIYKIPTGLHGKIAEGCAVNVPFKNKNLIGIVESIQNHTSYSGKINSVISIHHSNFDISQELWETIRWISTYYIAPLGLCIKAALPSLFVPPQKIKEDIYVQIDMKNIKEHKNFKLSKNETKVINQLINNDRPISRKTLRDSISNISDVLKRLSTKKLIKVFDANKELQNIKNKKMLEPSLSIQQNKIFDKIFPSITHNDFSRYLIHGVPGSGKTEIYIKLAQRAIKENKNVIVLIPEIILTTQMKDRFYQYFGDSVAMWHSKMTYSEKQRTLNNIQSGSNKIIVGPRSCIFTPMPNLGLIIIDEEQDSSYKQESPKPYYNGRDVGFIRALNSSCPIILTSATPSVDMYYNSIIDKIKILELKQTFYQSKPPKVTVVNMLDHFSEDGKQKIISPDLIQSIKDTLKLNKQIIILNNRRGYATSVFSKSNNDSISCDYCNVPMSFHKLENKLLCHYCDSKKLISQLNGNSDEIILNGYGTEKIQESLNTIFPNISIERIDSDVLRKKSILDSILTRFSTKEIDILIGTQMISKGLDFDSVHLVGVINADYGMFIPDFRSGERVFQIISQVIGRAGRRSEQGQAVIQTYNPDNSNLINAISGNMKNFYSVNLAERNELLYPPFSRLCRITFSGIDLETVRIVSNKITKPFLKSNFFKVLGPAEAPISKINNEWRINSLIMADRNKPMEIQNFFNSNLGTDYIEKAYNNVKIRLDIDPVNML